MHEQKAPIYKLSRGKVPEHSKFRLTDIWDKPVDFVWCPTGVDLAPAIILLTWKSFVSVKSIIPWSKDHVCRGCGTSLKKVYMYYSKSLLI